MIIIYSQITNTIFYNNKNYTIMKTLKKFECKNAIVTIKMHNLIEENVSALYSLTERPKRKNAGWHEETKYYDFTDDVVREFIKKVEFWCK